MNQVVRLVVSTRYKDSNIDKFEPVKFGSNHY